VLFMVIEHFRPGQAAAVYRRFRERGRMAPDDVRYLGSWVDLQYERCFQVMEADDALALRPWTSSWEDLVDFEIIPVRTSADAAAAMARRLDEPRESGYEVETREVASRALAVARGRANKGNVGERIGTLLAQVRDFLAKSNLEPAGPEIVVYLDEGDRGRFTTTEGVPVEVGMEVRGPFEGNGQVVSSTTPAGTVAMTVHVGPYQKLPEAHAAVRRFCAAQGRVVTGTDWEVYGEMGDDPEALRTEVYYLLK
jgi:effector-binding domain-containing protein